MVFGADKATISISACAFRRTLVRMYVYLYVDVYLCICVHMYKYESLSFYTPYLFFNKTFNMLLQKMIVACMCMRRVMHVCCYVSCVRVCIPCMRARAIHTG